MGWVFGMIGCRSLSHNLALPISFNNNNIINNNNNNDNPKALPLAYSIKMIELKAIE